MFSCSIMSNIFATSWTVACQASLSMGFPRQEYQSGLSFPSLGDLPDWGIKPESPKVAGQFFTTEPPGKPFYSALGAQSLSHWTSRVVPITPLLV